MAWYVVGPEVPGGLGDDAQLDTSVHPPVVSRLHYEFEGWLGDDIAESFPCFIVTERLAEALAAAGLTGFELDDVEVTIEPQLAEFEPELVRSMPAWRWLKPVGTPFADDVWQDGSARLHVSERTLTVLQRFNVEYADVAEATRPEV
jgi:hypothetical protein